MSMTDPTILQLLEKADCRYTLGRRNQQTRAPAD